MKRCQNSGDLVGLEQQPRKSRSIDIAQLFKKGRSFEYEVEDESPESESCDVDDASEFAVMMAKLCSMDDDREETLEDLSLASLSTAPRTPSPCNEGNIVNRSLKREDQVNDLEDSLHNSTIPERLVEDLLNFTLFQRSALPVLGTCHCEWPISRTYV
eukprot:CAMPEP_0173218854 /NCGR_PEP_ID=MMETSP1142-20121109/1287_1 /TAXON_ID=483371 /ORGANISM="non described non described, Strain CCMP2298" /LENGTH=157 /DNA_ID=CAMNT_0014146601 /DNA_START=34 /DNA_END=505 /DNA_ORIENTATION=+